MSTNENSDSSKRRSSSLNSAPQSSHQEDETRDIELFRMNAEELSRIATEAGFPVLPYQNPVLPHFRSLAPQARRALSQRFGHYVEVMSATAREPSPFVRPHNSMWRMLAATRMVPTSDLFTIIENEDVLEIYDLNGHQLYRSFSFFKLCTYSLEEIYALPWYELYARPDDVNQLEFAMMTDLLAGKITGTVTKTSPEHIVRESIGSKGRLNLIRPRFASPLFDRNGGLAGFVNAFQAVRSWDEMTEK